jgi:DNA-binding transcriptional LysR family regulator
MWHGIVRLSAPVEITQNVIATCLPRFLANYPHVRVQLLVSNRRIDLLSENIDIALRVRRVPDMDPKLITRPLTRVHSILSCQEPAAACRSLLAIDSAPRVLDDRIRCITTSAGPCRITSPKALRATA